MKDNQINTDILFCEQFPRSNKTEIIRKDKGEYIGFVRLIAKKS